MKLLFNIPKTFFFLILTTYWGIAHNTAYLNDKAICNELINIDSTFKSFERE